MLKIIYKSIGVVLLLMAATAGISAENYVNWKGGFWFAIPDGWDKVDYRVVDTYLRMTDTSRAVYNYEAVYAPAKSERFIDGAYAVITFDSTGKLTDRQSDSILNKIVTSYATEVYEAPIVKVMSDLVPGKPKLNRAEKVVSVLSDMAYQPDKPKKVWQYMQLNEHGLITFYFYSPESSYESNKEIFDGIIKSLSFENMREASGEELTFTDIGGDDVGADKIEYDDPIEEEQSAGGGSKKSTGLYFLFAGGALIILIVVIKLVRR